MDNRPLGRTGVSVSKLSLGTMMFGPWGNPDHADSIRIITGVEDSLRRLNTDRIDAIVAPGTNLNPTDAGWASPALAPAARRR